MLRTGTCHRDARASAKVAGAASHVRLARVVDLFVRGCTPTESHVSPQTVSGGSGHVCGTHCDVPSRRPAPRLATHGPERSSIRLLQQQLEPTRRASRGRSGVECVVKYRVMPVFANQWRPLALSLRFISNIRIVLSDTDYRGGTSNWQFQYRQRRRPGARYTYRSLGLSRGHVQLAPGRRLWRYWNWTCPLSSSGAPRCALPRLRLGLRCASALVRAKAPRTRHSAWPWESGNGGSVRGRAPESQPLISCHVDVQA